MNTAESACEILAKYAAPRRAVTAGERPLRGVEIALSKDSNGSQAYPCRIAPWLAMNNALTTESGQGV